MYYMIEVWGVWCKPCVAAIPALQELAERYQDLDVIFLGIHTAGGNVETINKLKKLKGWASPSAIDKGKSANLSATCKAYGIDHFPTIVVVNKAGRIAYRDDVNPPGIKDAADMAKAIEKLAKANGITIPGDAAGADELQNFITRIHVVMLSQQLDRLLKK